MAAHKRGSRSRGMGPLARVVGALLLCGAVALANSAPAPRARQGWVENEREVHANISGNGTSVAVVGSLDAGQSCDGDGARATAVARGTGVVSGDVSGAFHLVNASAALEVHCGARGVGAPSFEITIADQAALEVNTPTGENTTLARCAIRAAVYDDAGTGTLSLAGTLQSGGGDGGDSWWFDTCVGSFEVRTACIVLLLLFSPFLNNDDSTLTTLCDYDA